MRQFYRFLLAEGLRKDDPCSAIDSPKLGRPLPKLLSLAEVEALLGAAAHGVEQAGEGAAKRRALRINALLETLYATGLRVSELLGLSARRAHQRRSGDDHQGQRRPRAPRAAQRLRAQGARRSSRCRLPPMRRKEARRRPGCFRREAALSI